MNASTLSVEERQNIDAGAWFAKLSLPLREAILSRAVVRRLKDGASLSSRGARKDGAVWRWAQCASARSRCRASRSR
jgi:CRP/FNR family transcriptional regulator, cyclic AMP receptor protein